MALTCALPVHAERPSEKDDDDQYGYVAPAAYSGLALAAMAVLYGVGRMITRQLAEGNRLRQASLEEQRRHQQAMEAEARELRGAVERLGDAVRRIPETEATRQHRERVQRLCERNHRIEGHEQVVWTALEAVLQGMKLVQQETAAMPDWISGRDPRQWQGMSLLERIRHTEHWLGQQQGRESAPHWVAGWRFPADRAQLDSDVTRLIEFFNLTSDLAGSFRAEIGVPHPLPRLRRATGEHARDHFVELVHAHGHVEPLDLAKPAVLESLGAMRLTEYRHLEDPGYAEHFRALARSGPLASWVRAMGAGACGQLLWELRLLPLGPGP